ncbi:chemotaxis protein CheA [Methanosarcina sp. 2.H.A.1B.4]|uniref:chemotaxis protein CheA n=1 Tax=Methanosarcina sp. 2.H.A.1B.4 TaxID=1483600 RepID=UPI00350FE4A3
MQDSKTRVTRIQSSRISTEQLDKLMNLVGELVINRSRVKELTGESKSKDLELALSDFQKLTRELQEEVLEIRMIPLDHITNIFPRMIRDLARAQNKKINFIIKGKEIKLDRAIMEEIGDPLVHLLRNAVDHGIEIPEERGELGKEESGTIMITASKQQNYVLIKIEDNGRGISTEEIRKAALEKGLISRGEAEQLSEREAIQLIFAPGLSTASAVTDLSGRGIGMDVVKNRIERLGGSVKVESNPGSGSKFELRLPITIALYQAMLVKVGVERYAIPFTSIIKSISVRKEEVRHIRGEEVIVIDEKALPLLRLRKLFQLPAVQKEESLIIVIVEKAGRYIGLVVDSLLGKQEVIIKNFKSRLLEKTRGFAGATIMGDGSVILILDVNSII